MKQKTGIFDIINYLVLGLLVLSIILPIWHIFVISISTYEVYVRDPIHIIPGSFSLDAYFKAFNNISGVIRPLLVTVFVTLSGTILSMVLTCLGAYSLSKKYLPGRNYIFGIIVVTMFVSGGLVPFYLLVKGLGIYNTVFALFIPAAVSTFNLLVMKNYFTSLDESLEEAAKIDGYNDIQILFKIVIPISRPVIAAIALFYGVGYWNDYWLGVLFIISQKNVPFMVALRQMIINNKMVAQIGMSKGINAEQFKMASIIIGIIPVLITYPFVQKYFTKGIMIGSIKG